MSGFGALKIVTDKYCPPGMAYLLNGNAIVFCPAQRRRFWWKPWTWFRKNTVSGYPFKQHFETMTVEEYALTPFAARWLVDGEPL
jgi:hypothetical protein